MPVKQRKRATDRAVRRRSMQLTIRQLMDKYIYRIDTDADYQREKVWSKTDQELLLDSIAKGIDIPKIYLAKISGKRDFDYECVDGKQRLLTLSSFFSPDTRGVGALHLNVLGQKYTYQQLRDDLPHVADRMAEYKIDFVIYDEASLTEEFVRDVFKRLQLGQRLNSGELLNAQMGTIRDFVFAENGKNGPFLGKTKLSEKRYSRQFALAQICINSFHRHAEGEFTRARLIDLEDFFEEKSGISKNDDNLVRIRNVLQIMDAEFDKDAQEISSRAVAISAYLFTERLVATKKAALVPKFVDFYVGLLRKIKQDMELLRTFKEPKFPVVLEKFQKHILQASVEPLAIRRRDDFLQSQFEKYIQK
jgi:hypothetical protein